MEKKDMKIEKEMSLNNKFTSTRRVQKIITGMKHVLLASTMAFCTASAGISKSGMPQAKSVSQTVVNSEQQTALREEEYYVDALESIANQLRFINLDDPANPQLLSWVNWNELSSNILIHSEAISGFEDFLLQDFQQEEDNLNSNQQVVTEQIKQQIINEFHQFDVIFKNLQQAYDNGNSNAQRSHLIQLARFMQNKATSRGFKKLNFTNSKSSPASVRASKKDKKELNQWLNSKKLQNSNAKIGSTDPQSVVTKNATDPQYLQESIEVQITPRITELAQSLNNNPIEIYSWVKNNIQHLPTYGSLQGSNLTLMNGQGNSFDISALLIALLRSSGIPSRYAYGVIEVPSDRLVNWMKVDTVENAISLLSQGGIPSNIIVEAGHISAVQMEHVWVEAWVDFIPSRGVHNITGDSWVSLDAGFKQHEFIPAIDTAQYGTFDLNQVVTELNDSATHGQFGSITNVDVDHFRYKLNDYMDQVIPALDADHPGATAEELTNRYKIIETSRMNLPSSLENKILFQAQSLATLPEGLMHHLQLKMYASDFDLAAGSTQIDYSIPLPQLGLSTLSIEFAAATATDQDTINQHLRNNDLYLRPYLINVKPQVQIDGVPQAEGSTISMGQKQYWTTAIVDPHNLNSAPTAPFEWTTGSQIVLAVDAAGITPDAFEAHNAGIPNLGSGHIRNALHQAGLNYFVGHDYMDNLFAQQVGGRMMRMPSVGAFYSPMNVRYFFGIPRTANMSSYETDVKKITAAMVAPTDELKMAYAAQSGTTGSALEGMGWEMLFNKPLGSSALSTMAILHKANSRGVPIHTITQANLADVMPLLQLSADSEQEIYNAVSAGYEVTTPEYEFDLGEFQGTGYVVKNPYNGSALYRLEGGTNGAALVGCIARAILINVIFEKILDKIWKKLTIALVIVYGVSAIFAPAGVILGIVEAFVSNIYYLMAFGQALIEFTQMLATMDINEILEKYGIESVVAAACTLLSPCTLKSKLGKGGFKSSCRGGMCKMGSMTPNPTDVLTGAKHQYQTDYESSSWSGLNFTRLYYSVSQFNSPAGVKWTHSYNRKIILGDSLEHPWPQNVLVVNDDGGWYQFNRGGVGGDEYFPRSDITLRLQALGSDTAAPSGFKVINDDDETEIYNNEGRLTSIKSRDGVTISFAYNVNEQLETITDSFGHQIRLQYDVSSKLLSKMIDPALQEYSYQHDAIGNLIQVTYPDNTTIKYHYEDNALPNMLTGITNENNIRYATYKYNLDRQVTDTYWTGENGFINHYHLQYGDNQTIVTDPLGKARTYQYERINEQDRLVAIDETCSACGSGGNSIQIWDGRGWLSEEIDFNGNKTGYSFNARGLETRMTEAKGTPLERSTNTTWHVTYSLPETITEPSATSGNKVTTFTYYANGNVKTKTITADGEDRTWSYTYNSYGQMLTEDGPRTDISDITVWTYDTQGNKRTKTNALGHLVSWDNYNAHGQPQSMTDENNVVTTYEYDELTRMTHSTTDGEVTQYVYTPTGNLDKLILPDGSFLDYGYDPSDRLTSITDNLGNRIKYSLDAAGNRLTEETFNDSAALVQTITNVYNNLGQLEQSFGADLEVTAWTYDNNGNEKTHTDPLNKVTGSDYDALNRLEKITDPDLNTIQYSYDKQDNLRTVTDPRSLVTTYTYNGFNEQVKLTSPDTGITGYSYDAAGNLLTKTDARNQQAVYSYDALNRVDTITYSDEVLDFTYDQGINGKGRLSLVTDNSGQTSYSYDTHGRVDIKTQTTAGVNLINDYDYNASGQLQNLTTPSGVQISYSYRADGRVTTVSVNGVEITRDIEYFAFGEPGSWNYGNNFTYQRTFDGDGRVETYTQGSDTQTLAYNPASRVESLTDTGNSWAFSYDNLDRLKTADKADTSLSWDYDPTGNRIYENLNGTQTDYSTDPLSNKLSQLGTSTRLYDDAGNLQDDGSISSTYSGRNRLVSTQGALAPTLYQYNAFGERVSKQSSTQTLFAYDEQGHLLGEYDSSGNLIAETIWLDDTPIATIRPNTESHNGLTAANVKVFFIHPDHLDTPRTIVDASNQAIWQWHSDPFGTTKANEDIDNDGNNFVSNLRFPGQYFDIETNTHYNYFRDYDPETGRYVQSDPIGLEGDINTYTYVSSDPNYSFDPEGLKRKSYQPKKKDANKYRKAQQCCGNTAATYTVCVDVTSGKKAFGYSGRSGRGKISPKLKKRLPNKSREPNWKSDNCGEVDAANKLILKGSKPENISCYSVDHRGNKKGMCNNCKFTFRGHRK